MIAINDPLVMVKNSHRSGNFNGQVFCQRPGNFTDIYDMGYMIWPESALEWRVSRVY